MKKLFISLMVIIVIAVAFYAGYYQSKSPTTAKTPVGNNSLAVQYQDNNLQIQPREVAINFFQACSAGDWNRASTYCPYVDRLTTLINLQGLEIISIGEPYKKTPNYRGLHIPYEIKFPSGETKKYDLAVRNDNPTHLWQVDGGI